MSTAEADELQDVVADPRDGTGTGLANRETGAIEAMAGGEEDADEDP